MVTNNYLLNSVIYTLSSHTRVGGVFLQWTCLFLHLLLASPVAVIWRAECLPLFWTLRWGCCQFWWKESFLWWLRSRVSIVELRCFLSYISIALGPFIWSMQKEAWFKTKPQGWVGSVFPPRPSQRKHVYMWPIHDSFQSEKKNNGWVCTNLV